uniref:Proline-rich coiled-coil 2C n=1 Tax=Gasterosteus aculeatus TaxID=69293 RepID=G3PP53_GASAC
KQKAELRWAARSSAARRDGPGGERPARRSGPIKKPVLRDMKEEREQREEREKRQERGERGDRPKKDPSCRTPSAAAVVSEASGPPEEHQGDAAEPEESRDAPPSSVVPAAASQEEKLVDKPPSADKHPEPKLPCRKESSLPPRPYRRDEREKDADMDKDREREWPADSNFKGRGRGEYYSRGRSYRGTYSGRNRGGRGRSRAEFNYREPRSRSDLPSAGGAAAFRNREESETRSESSDFEVIPKRRRRRGSDTDSESEGGRESASDTGPSDREPSTKPARPLRRELPGEARPAPHKPGFGPPHVGERAGPRGDDDGRPKPGFLPKGEPSRRGRGGLYNRRGGARVRRPGARESPSHWPSKPMETFRPEDAESSPRYDNPAAERRFPKPEGKRFGDVAPQSGRERPRRTRPARPPRQDKPPRFRRLKEREAAGPANDLSSPTEAPLPETSSPPGTAAGTKSPDLSNQNSSDQANEEWETASESSDFNERREREERRGALEAASEAANASRDGAPPAKRSFSSQRPAERQNRRGNSAAKPVRSYTGGKGERRGGGRTGRKGMNSRVSSAPGGRFSFAPDLFLSVLNSPAALQNSEGGAPGAGAASQRPPKDQSRRKDEAKQAAKKPKENALSQFDLNNYASVVIIDDHPEVTTTEDPQSNPNDDGFTEVVSRKQQKRLQDEEKRKKEEQTPPANWSKKGASEKGRGGGGKLPPRFAKKQSTPLSPLQFLPLRPSTSPPPSPLPPPSLWKGRRSHSPPSPLPPWTSPQRAYCPRSRTALWVQSCGHQGVSRVCLSQKLNGVWGGRLFFMSLEKAYSHARLEGDRWGVAPSVSCSAVYPSEALFLRPAAGYNQVSESGRNVHTADSQGARRRGNGDVKKLFGGGGGRLAGGLPSCSVKHQLRPSVQLPELEPVEPKEYKPGPIGKERSLKNRKAIDAEGGEGGVPGGGVGRATDPSPPISDAAVPELGGDIEGMITVASAEYHSNSKESVTDYTTPSASLADSVPTGVNKIDESLVANVALPHPLPLPRRETLQQSSSLSTVSPATVDLTLKMESARKAWENSPSLEKNSPIMPQIPVASVTPSTSLSGAGTYTTSSLGTKTATACDPPNICKVKPQQLQVGGLSSNAGSFSQLGCVPTLLPPQQQQTPQVYVSQSAAAQIPAFYMDTSHLFGNPHPRLAPPSLAQQQGFQPGISQPTAVQQIPIPIYAQHQAQLGLSTGPPVSQHQDLFSSSLQPYRSQQAFMQSSLSQPSMMLSGPPLHSYAGVQASELGKPQSGLAYQQASSTQHIPILFEPQLNQPSGMGGSQLMDTHLLQARQGMSQHSNMYSGQVQQHGQSSYYSSTQSPSSAMQQMTVQMPSSLSLPNFGSGGGQPLLALPPTPPQAQPPNINRQPPVSQPYRGLMGPNHSMM